MDQIRSLIRILPPPASRYECDGVAIEIYKAKELFQSHWNHDVVWEVLMAARHSYQVYGKRPLTDDLDGKSAVYLARAIYAPYEEWLSFRLVPFTGTPWGAQELDKFAYLGQSVEELVKTRLYRGDPRFGESLSASSRMCGIHPFSDEGKSLLRHRYSALCYALISRHFYDDYLSTLGIRYISGIILDKFVESTLTMEIRGKRYATLFVPAADQLGISRNEVKLQRRAYDNYAYAFPGYWFHAKQLIGLLGELLKRGQLSEMAMAYYLGITCPFEEIISQHLPVMEILGQLCNLGELLTVRGGIAYSRMSGEQLRDLVDIHVADAPELKLTEVCAVDQSVTTFLAAVGAKRTI